VHAGDGSELEEFSAEGEKDVHKAPRTASTAWRNLKGGRG